MRRVKVVTGLKVEERWAGDCVEVFKQVFYPPYPTNIRGTDDFLISDFPIEREIIPVLPFCTRGKPDLLVAYSAEVEEILGVPIRALSKENDELRLVARDIRDQANATYYTVAKTVYKYKHMSLWQRIKFLFGVHPE